MIESTSNERTVNNVMRHQYKVLSDAEKADMQAIKDAGLAFHELCDTISLVKSEDGKFCSGGSREMSIAKTKIEEAVMWAVKHLTR